jgi:hypothetical protein
MCPQKLLNSGNVYELKPERDRNVNKRTSIICNTKLTTSLFQRKVSDFSKCLQASFESKFENFSISIFKDYKDEVFY